MENMEIQELCGVSQYKAKSVCGFHGNLEFYSEESLGCLNVKLHNYQAIPSMVGPKGWIVQTDGGCFEEGVVSFGCVICDPTSNIFLAPTKRISSIMDLANAEILAIRWLLQVAKDLGLKEFVLQSDAFAVVDCVNGFVTYADLNPIVLDCKTLFSRFSDVSIMFIIRIIIVDAHQLAGIGRTLGSRTWTGHIPNIGPSICNSSFPSI